MITGFFAMMFGLISLVIVGFFYLIVFIGTLFGGIFLGQKERYNKELAKKVEQSINQERRYRIVDVRDKLKILDSSDDYVEAQAKKWVLRNNGYLVMIKEAENVNRLYK